MWLFPGAWGIVTIPMTSPPSFVFLLRTVVDMIRLLF